MCCLAQRTSWASFRGVGIERHSEQTLARGVALAGREREGDGDDCYEGNEIEVFGEGWAAVLLYSVGQCLLYLTRSLLLIVDGGVAFDAVRLHFGRLRSMWRGERPFF